MKENRTKEQPTAQADSLGERIKRLRRKAGLTQEQLGKLVYISRSCIANYESGIREPQRKTIIEFATIFHVSIEYLIYGKPSPYESFTERLTKMKYRIDLSDMTMSHRVQMLKYYDSILEKDRDKGL